MRKDASVSRVCAQVRVMCGEEHGGAFDGEGGRDEAESVHSVPGRVYWQKLTCAIVPLL